MMMTSLRSEFSLSLWHVEVFVFLVTASVWYRSVRASVLEGREDDADTLGTQYGWLRLAAQWHAGLRGSKYRGIDCHCS